MLINRHFISLIMNSTDIKHITHNVRIYNRSIMSFLFSIFAIGMLLSCSAAQSTHGNQIDSVNIDKIQIGTTTQSDLTLLLGPPSFRGAFNSGNLYYSNVTKRAPLARKEIVISSELYVFSFDNNGLLLNMNKIDALPKDFDYEGEKTNAPGVNIGILEQIFFNLRRGQITE